MPYPQQIVTAKEMDKLGWVRSKDLCPICQAPWGISCFNGEAGPREHIARWISPITQAEMESLDHIIQGTGEEPEETFLTSAQLVTQSFVDESAGDLQRAILSMLRAIHSQSIEQDAQRALERSEDLNNRPPYQGY